jgi:hypothetical protein
MSDALWSASCLILRMCCIMSTHSDHGCAALSNHLKFKKIPDDLGLLLEQTISRISTLHGSHKCDWCLCNNSAEITDISGECA